MNTLQFLEHGRVLVNGHKLFNCSEVEIVRTAGEVTQATITIPIGEVIYGS